MTIEELIERLEEYREAIGGDAEVRLMTQQQWPFENRICGLASSEEIADCYEDDEDEGGEEGQDKPAAVLFLVEGGQIGYGSKKAWEVAQ